MFRVRDRILWVLQERELPPEDNPTGVGYHVNFFRQRSIPPLTTRALTGSEREMDLPGYINAIHCTYYEDLPPYPRYLFKKFAYYRTGTYLPTLEDDIPVQSDEWFDTVYVSEGLLNYFGGSRQLEFLIDDRKYVEQNMHILNERQVSAYTFLMAILPRIANKNALVMYEEYLPDWCRIIDGYLNVIRGTNFTFVPEQIVNHVRPVRSAIERIDEEATEALEEAVENVANAISGANTTAVPPIEAGASAGSSAGTSAGASAGASSSAEGNDDLLLCKICYCAQRSTVYMPCRHCISCKDCTISWLARIKKCPLCNMPSNSYVNFYLS
jgi:rubrerythrin